MGYLRGLKPRQKARVKALRATKSVKPAIAFARRLGTGRESQLATREVLIGRLHLHQTSVWRRLFELGRALALDLNRIALVGVGGAHMS